MAVINRSITEQDLKEIKQALVAVENTRHADKVEAEQLANDMTYGVFRNLIDPESVRRWIVSQALRTGKSFA